MIIIEKILIEKISAKLKIKAVALISDAGSPLISDPGYKLVQFCIKIRLILHLFQGQVQ